MMLKRGYLCTLLLLLVGCGAATNDSINEENRPHPQQVRNETPLEEQLTYYKDFVDVRKLQKENLADNHFNHYTDPYTTEESQEITKQLMENRNIIVAEVRIIEDQVFVAVKLKENNYERDQNINIVTTIENDVKEMLADDEKQVIVYTDNTQWQQLKNHHAEPKMNSIFDAFFNENE